MFEHALIDKVKRMALMMESSNYFNWTEKNGQTLKDQVKDLLEQINKEMKNGI